MDLFPVFRETKMCTLPEKQEFNFKFHRVLELLMQPMVLWIPN